MKGSTVLYLIIHMVVWLTAFASVTLLINICMLYYRDKIITVLSECKPLLNKLLGLASQLLLQLGDGKCVHCMRQSLHVQCKQFSTLSRITLQ